MPIGYQNQSTVWYLGGDNVTFDGHGSGTFHGNGQVWYDFVNGVSNYPSAFKSSATGLAKKLVERPMALTIWNTRNSGFQGLRFIQSQMW
jgi:hypothetical protein